MEFFSALAVSSYWKLAVYILLMIEETGLDDQRIEYACSEKNMRSTLEIAN